MRIKVALVSLLCFHGVVHAQSASIPNAFVAIDTRLRARADSSRSAIAVAVAQHGRIIWEAGYGFSDAARTTPATAHTPFAVGSVAKSVTATALMRLAERGVLKLDEPISTYLPGEVVVYQGDAKRLTAAALATMTAGIPHVSRHYYASDVNQAHSTEALVRAYGNSVFPPGEFYHYSNMSFGVLERLIEKVTRKPFGQVVAEEVFNPLAMRNSFFCVAVQHAAVYGASHEQRRGRQ